MENADDWPLYSVVTYVLDCRHWVHEFTSRYLVAAAVEVLIAGAQNLPAGLGDSFTLAHCLGRS